MPVLHRHRRYAPLPDSIVATIGNFDGVHRGHQALITALKRLAHRYQVPGVVISFEPLSHEFFRREPSARRLQGVRDKCEALQSLGVDYIQILRFNQRLSAMTPEAFFQRNIAGKNVRGLVVGHDFRFGAGGRGTVESLRTLCVEAGVELVVIQAIAEAETTRISSSLLRQVIEAGDLDRVARLLGRPYSLCGRVVPGLQLGRTLGFPTANLKLSNPNPPLRGVFAAWARICETGARYRAAVNIGIRPSIREGGRRLVCEAHLLDFDGELYGTHMKLDFTHRVRGERAFPNLEDLQRAIADDVDVIRHLR